MSDYAILQPKISPMPSLYFRNPAENRQHPNRTGTVATEKNQDDDTTPGHEDLRCKACKHKITTHTETINVSGAHQHTFANPNGIVFEIGCFKIAPGCRHTGPFTPEFSWFPGYSWQISVCGSCLTHLGWRFVSAENDFFYGLILDRLIIY